VHLLDELAQAQRGAGGGFLLGRRDVLVDLLVAEVDLPYAARDETPGKQDERDQEVVPEQSAAPALGDRRGRRRSGLVG